MRRILLLWTQMEVLGHNRSRERLFKANKVVVPARQAINRFLGSLFKVYKFELRPINISSYTSAKA